MAERDSSLAIACNMAIPNGLRVELSTTEGSEREAALEPTTFSLEGRGGHALWHPSWGAEHLVSSNRVVVWASCAAAANRSSSSP